MGRLARICIALGAVAALTAPATAQPNPDWDKVVAAAKAEGSVTFYTGLPGNPTTKKIGEAFEKKYGVRMDVLEMRATELRERIRTERASNRALGDVMHTSNNQTRQMAAEDATIDKYGPLPNESRIRKDLQQGWLGREIQIPTFTLNYALLVNAAQVPDPPKSWSGLLDPKWKGKILSDDYRATGGGSSFFAVTYDKFGRDYHEKLAAQNVAFTRDMREAERRVARGEYAMYLPWLLNYLPSLKGLPVKAVVPRRRRDLSGLFKFAAQQGAASECWPPADRLHAVGRRPGDLRERRAAARSGRQLCEQAAARSCLPQRSETSRRQHAGEDRVHARDGEGNLQMTTLCRGGRASPANRTA